ADPEFVLSYRGGVPIVGSPGRLGPSALGASRPSGGPPLDPPTWGSPLHRSRVGPVTLGRLGPAALGASRPAPRGGSALVTVCVGRHCFSWSPRRARQRARRSRISASKPRGTGRGEGPPRGGSGRGSRAPRAPGACGAERHP